jgi:hypothetical protein
VIKVSEKNNDNVSIKTESSVPGVGIDTIYTATDKETGESSKGWTEEQAREKLEESQSKKK